MYVWVIGHQGFMGYGHQLSANEVGKHECVWGLRDCGLEGREL